MERNGNKLYIEKSISRILALLNPYKSVFLSTFIFGLLTHGFVFANKLVNHDEVGSLFTKGATLISGRWALKILSYIFPDFSMPWISGALVMFFFALAVCLLVSMFSIKRRLFQVLLAALIISFPSLIGTFGYMFTSVSYAVSFLLAITAAWIVSKDTNKFFVLALLPMVFSLGIYQSYLSLTASLLVLRVLQRILNRENLAKIWASGVRYVMFLGLSLILYYVTMILSQRITGIHMGSYAANSLDNGDISIFDKIVLAYSTYRNIILHGKYGLIFSGLSRNVHFFLIGGTLILLAFQLYQLKNIKYAVTALLVVFLYPLSVNCIFLFVSKSSVHTLVVYSFVTIYLLFILLFENVLDHDICKEYSFASLKKLIVECSVVCMILISCSNVFVGNQAYLKMYLKYENTYAFFATVLSQIEQRSDFDENTKIAIIGTYQSPEYYGKFEQANQITGVAGMDPTRYTNREFIMYYMGLDIPFATNDEIAQIKNTQEYANMSVYPYSGCIEKIGSIIVVKLS